MPYIISFNAPLIEGAIPKIRLMVGDKGYMYMMDEWFDEYLFEITVRKKYLSPELLGVLCTEPVVLSPWDPMRTLARHN
jgi:bleomycin hydrolase